MKEETKHQLPSYGAILIAIIGAITTSIQYCNTVEETRRAEIAQKATNEVIIDELSKEIAQVQKDMDALYRKAERVSLQQEILQAQCRPTEEKPKANWRDFATSFSGKSASPTEDVPSEDGRATQEGNAEEPAIVRPQVRSAQDIKQGIYQSIESKE